MPARASAPGIHRAGTQLWCDGVPLDDLAQRFGTPLYVYSARRIRAQVERLRRAFAATQPLIHFAVKAASNLSLLRLLARCGVGFDVVSGGELARLDAAGIRARSVVYAGVGKQDWEVRAALQRGVTLVNVESVEELALVDRIARAMRRTAPVALRLNPDVDPGAHRYVTTGTGENKFGIDLRTAESVVDRARRSRGVRLAGVQFHLGSTLTRVAPYLRAVDRVLDCLDRWRVPDLRWLDIGGGFGVRYRDEATIDLDRLGREVARRLEGRGLELILEPGRFLVAEAGCLVTRVLFRKRGATRRFVVVDAAMNDLIRPSLYSAWHRIEPVAVRSGRKVQADVVGPVCESADFLGHDRRLVEPARGELLAVLTAGAYGFSMTSNYNSRPRPAEVLVDGERFRVIRRRESLEDLWRLEPTPR